MKIYLSGSITKDPNYVEKFGNYEAELEDYAEIINPANHIPFLGLKIWLCYMITSIRELISCDFIYMLPGWEISRGAKIERFVAKLAGIDVVRVNECPSPGLNTNWVDTTIYDMGDFWDVFYTASNGVMVFSIIPKIEEEKPLWIWQVIRRII